MSDRKKRISAKEAVGYRRRMRECAAGGCMWCQETIRRQGGRQETIRRGVGPS